MRPARAGPAAAAHRYPPAHPRRRERGGLLVSRRQAARLPVHAPADGSDQRLVSTGKGRTTCAYFVDNRHILYASTHLASAACPKEPDRSRGYVWGIFPAYDIFLATDTGKIEKRLTRSPGYDAEATVNWKTAARSFPGTGRSWYGARIIPGRPSRSRPTKSLLADNLVAPMKIEIMVADGRNARQVTNFGCASFALTFTPDGRMILFASNRHKCDSRYFDLYLVNPDGSGLEQVTDFGGFTAFPEFSPDGKTLTFCSDHDAAQRYEFNIFTAKW